MLAPPVRAWVEANWVCDYLLGCVVTRRYGFTAFQPLGNSSLASSSDTAGTMMTSSPSFQLAGVATL